MLCRVCPQTSTFYWQRHRDPSAYPAACHTGRSRNTWERGACRSARSRQNSLKTTLNIMNKQSVHIVVPRRAHHRFTVRQYQTRWQGLKKQSSGLLFTEKWNRLLEEIRGRRCWTGERTMLENDMLLWNSFSSLENILSVESVIKSERGQRETRLHWQNGANRNSSFS